MARQPTVKMTRAGMQPIRKGGWPLGLNSSGTDGPWGGDQCHFDQPRRLPPLVMLQPVFSVPGGLQLLPLRYQLRDQFSHSARVARGEHSEQTRREAHEWRR